MAESRRRRQGRRTAQGTRDGGVVTAELAVALPAVALSAAAVVAVAQVGVAQIDCVDAARAGARAASRGDSASHVQQVALEAAGGVSAVVAVESSSAEVTVQVHRRVRLVLPHGPSVTVRGRASAEAEQRFGAGSDGGSATVLATAVVTVSALLAVLLAGLASAVVARHRAASAADLAALAAARALGRSPAAACDLAEDVARRNAAHVTACVAGATSVEVSVSVRPAGAAARLGEAVSRARAGPPAPASPSWPALHARARAQG